MAKTPHILEDIAIVIRGNELKKRYAYVGAKKIPVILS